jgi:hypothetical protein
MALPSTTASETREYSTALNPLSATVQSTEKDYAPLRLMIAVVYIIQLPFFQPL